jgi:hypothetical protein
MKSINFRAMSGAGKRTASRNSPFPIHGYDRVTVWLDRAELPLNKIYLESECTRLVESAEQMRFNARWKLRLEIHQPTDECLRRLLSAAGRDVAIFLSYVEIACDWIGRNRTQTQRWRNALLASIHVNYQRGPISRCLSTWYCNERTKAGVKRGNVLAMYADRTSKLNNAQPDADALPCLHMEWRASGSAALKSFGLVTLADLLDFDHRHFWSERLRVYELPRKTELGRQLAKASGMTTEVSGTALRRRTQRWVGRHSDKGRFVLHNGLQERPELARRLTELPFWGWCETAIRP